MPHKDKGKEERPAGLGIYNPAMALRLAFPNHLFET